METNVIFNRKGILDKDGKGLVEIQIYLSRTNRPVRSTGVRVMPKFWDAKKSCVKKSHPEFDFLNKQILNHKLHIEKQLLENQLEQLKQNSKSSTTKNTNLYSILEIIDLYVINLEKQANKAFGTLRNHKIKRKNLEQYEIQQKSFYYPDNFTPVEAEKFKDWFMNRCKTKNVTSANRNILFYKQCLQWAVKKGLIQHFSLYNYTGEKDAVKEPVFITKQEFETMLKQNFASKMLNQCKDLYIFQCATGLSYGDLWSDFEIQELNDEKVITGKRTKNGQAFFIPLNFVAESILFKYDYSLPRYCNAVYNRILKEIASVCGIEKRLTTHTGRKTFATLLNDDGWSRESIALMLGHNS